MSDALQTDGSDRRLVRRRVAIGAAALAAVTLSGVVALYGYRRSTTPMVPAIEFAELDPGIARAIERAQKLVEQNPRSAAVWGRLGMILRAHDFIAECKVCFAEAERLNPREPRWPYFHGLTLLMGEPDAGIQRVRRAVELCGDLPHPRLRLAEALLAQGDLNEAHDHFLRALQLEPENPRAHLGLARLAYARDDFESSLDHLRRSIAADPQRKTSHILLAQVLTALGDHEQAEHELRQANTLPRDRSWPDPFVVEVERLQTGLSARLARANWLLLDGHSEDAAALLSQIVRDYPGSDQAHFLLGQTLLRMGHLQNAEPALRTAVRLGPTNADACFQLGVLLYLQEDLDAAFESFRKTVTLKPDYVLAYFNLGKCMQRQGDAARAIDAFRSALRYKPDFADAHLNLANLLAEQGEAAEAERHRNHAASLAPVAGDSTAAPTAPFQSPPANQQRRE